MLTIAAFFLFALCALLIAKCAYQLISWADARPWCLGCLGLIAVLSGAVWLAGRLGLEAWAYGLGLALFLMLPLVLIFSLSFILGWIGRRHTSRH